MSENFKLDINIPQKEIANMAKQVIREIINTNIEQVMEGIDIKKELEKQISSAKITKVVNDNISKQIKDMKYAIQRKFKEEMREIVLEQINSKPLSGNVYLKLNNADIETDYDY